jgi:hypothetical protein
MERGARRVKGMRRRRFMRGMDEVGEGDREGTAFGITIRARR